MKEQRGGAEIGVGCGTRESVVCTLKKMTWGREETELGRKRRATGGAKVERILKPEEIFVFHSNRKSFLLFDLEEERQK